MSVETNPQHAVAIERERFKSVMSSPIYKGREAAANQMLLTTDMSAERICGALSGLTAPANSAGDFEQGKQIAAQLPAAMRRNS